MPPSSTARSTARAAPASARRRRRARGLEDRRHQALPEIGADDLGIALHLGRRALGDLAAEIERHDLVGDAHHQVHVMLDQQDGDAEPVADRDDELAQVDRLPRG